MTGYAVGQVITLPAEPPVGVVLVDSGGDQWRREPEGWAVRYGEGEWSLPTVGWWTVQRMAPLTILAVPKGAPDPAVALARAVVDRGHYETCGTSLTERPGDCNCPVSLAAAYLAGRQQ